jgi:hypothetical protein
MPGEKGCEKVDKGAERPEELEKEAVARLALDLLHRTIVHHTLWFAEVEHQTGRARTKALDTMGAVSCRSFPKKRSIFVIAWRPLSGMHFGYPHSLL